MEIPLGKYMFSMCLQITDFLVNATKHLLKPKHQLSTVREKAKLLKKYNLEEKQVSKFHG